MSGVEKEYDESLEKGVVQEGLEELGGKKTLSFSDKVQSEMSGAISVIAAACHMANRAYCQALGDNSQAVWEEAPDWQKQSCIKGVQGALNGNTPEQSHESWLEEKRATGWKYGPVKDVEKKEHPCFVPYAELPEEQRKKDDIFVMTARSIAAAIGFVV